MRHSGTASASFYYFYPILWALRKCLWHDHYNWAMTYQSVLKAEFLIMFITHLSSCHFHILKCSSTVFQKICAFTLNQTHNWPLVKSIQITHNYSVAWLFHDRHGDEYGGRARHAGSRLDLISIPKICFQEWLFPTTETTSFIAAIHQT